MSTIFSSTNKHASQISVCKLALNLVFYYMMNNGTYKVAPGPSPLYLLTSIPKFLYDPLQFFSDIVRRYGDLVCFKHGPRQLVLINHPAFIKHVLKTNHTNYRRGEALADLDALLGNGLFISRGAFWQQQRRLMKPALQGQQIEKAGPLMCHAVEELLARWHRLAQRNRPIDIEMEMKHLALNMLYKITFSPGKEIDKEAVIEALNTVLAYASLRNHTIRLAWSLVAQFLHLTGKQNHGVHEALKVLNDTVYGTINACLKKETQPGYLLSILIKAHQEAKISKRQMRDEMMNVLFAGFDTVSEALTWTWYLLGRHPEVERQLQAELQQVLGGRPSTMQEPVKLPYTQMVIQESMRLYPPAWAFHRMPYKNDAIGGYPIPANTYVMICPYTLHRHPDFWDHPDAFQPERFKSTQPASALRFKYIPFGDGPHVCLGNRIAMAEIQLIMAMIAQQYRLTLVSNKPVKAMPMITIRPHQPLYMTLHKQPPGV